MISYILIVFYRIVLSIGNIDLHTTSMMLINLLSIFYKEISLIRIACCIAYSNRKLNTKAKLNRSRKHTIIPKHLLFSVRVLVSLLTPILASVSLCNLGHRIVSEHLDEFDLASSPDKVLREILDVPSTIPIWVEKKIMDVFSKHDLIEDNKEKIAKYTE